jgi:Transposase DDE domain
MLGETPINLLVLSVVCYGCAVPLFWVSLEKRGNSNTDERITLMKLFVEHFGIKRVKYLCADREFIGEDWVRWLLQSNLPFRIRIKNCEYIRYETTRGKITPKEDAKEAQIWFEKRACSCKSRPVLLWGLSVYVGGKHLYEGEYLVIISNEPGNLLEDYKKRWKIETLFQALKGRGFDLESCRLTIKNRLESWFGFLAFGFCWCLRTGYEREFQARQRNPALVVCKNHGRRIHSIFQCGLRFLQRNLAALSGSFNEREFSEALLYLDQVRILE